VTTLAFANSTTITAYRQLLPETLRRAALTPRPFQQHRAALQAIERFEQLAILND
jgi:hypothetical protein